LLNLCYEAGIPNDILRGIHPSPNQYASINADRRLHAINFTGGTQAGTAIASQAGMKPLLMELGGNDPFIVMPDADIESAVDIAIAQRFGTAGQRCTAPKRFFIHQQVKAKFIEQLVEKTKQLSVGDPMDDQTFIGPVIHESAARQIHERIKQACYLNAKLLVGGQREGSIVFPTVMDEVPMQADLIAEETFGPVIAMQSFERLEDVIQKVNRSQYGLQAAVFTQDMQVAQRLYQNLEVGALIVNDGPGFRAEHFPFGGVKASGLGREGVGYAIKAMSYQKLWVI
jgi:acyl-CoA reductase-like NAD-dependent aldehyde dehydrogenase